MGRCCFPRPYDLTLEWIEKGRSIFWNQILQLRTTSDSVSAVDPEFADRLGQTVQELEMEAPDRCCDPHCTLSQLK